MWYYVYIRKIYQKGVVNMRAIVELKKDCLLSFEKIFEILSRECKKYTMNKMMYIIYEEHDYRHVVNSSVSESFAFALNNENITLDKETATTYTRAFLKDKVKALNDINQCVIRKQPWTFYNMDTSFRMVGRRFDNDTRIVEIISRCNFYYDAICNADWVKEELNEVAYSVFKEGNAFYSLDIAEIEYSGVIVRYNKKIDFDSIFHMPEISMEDMKHIPDYIVGRMNKLNRIALILSSDKVKERCLDAGLWKDLRHEPDFMDKKEGFVLIDDMEWAEILTENISHQEPAKTKRKNQQLKAAFKGILSNLTK